MAVASLKIIVQVEGGVIQDILGIPDDVIVEVHDWDVDEGDHDIEVFGPLLEDEDGNKYIKTLWE